MNESTEPTLVNRFFTGQGTSFFAWNAMSFLVIPPSILLGPDALLPCLAPDPFLMPFDQELGPAHLSPLSSSPTSSRYFLPSVAHRDDSWAYSSVFLTSHDFMDYT